MNQMSGLKEIFVFPSSKLTAGPEKLRSYFSHEKRNNVHMNNKEGKEQSSISDHSNWHIHPSSSLSKLISGEQKLRTTFLEGREDDKTILRTSTFTSRKMIFPSVCFFLLAVLVITRQ
jgi:hypothetical protein